MKRKLWAIKELSRVFGAELKIMFRVMLVWNVNPQGVTARDRSRDLARQIFATPFGPAYRELLKRRERAAIALLRPQLDAAMLHLQELVDTTDSTHLKKLLATVNDAIVQRSLGS